MKIIDLEIKNVRGIKDIVLHPDEKNFVVWGSNGSGKSAIVDAIDFLLTGQMARLTGSGTRNISLKKHGAHIDCSDLSRSYVRATIKITGFKTPFEIFRCLDKPNKLILPTNVHNLFSPIEDIARRGQHVLTRREILRFITAEGGKRAEDIQTLLNLSDVEIIRKAIGRVVGGFEKEFSISQRNLLQAKSSVASRIGHIEFEENEVLRTVNAHRSKLSGKPLSKISSNLLKSNIIPPTIFASKKDINITIYEQDLKNISVVNSNEFKTGIREKDVDLRNLVTSLHEDESLLRAFATQKLVDLGISLLDDSGKCPLCDKDWNPSDLRTHLEMKLGSAKVVQSQLQPIEELSHFLSAKITFVQISLERVIRGASLLSLNEDVDELIKWQTRLNKLKSFIDNPLYQYHNIEFTNDQVQRLLAPNSIQIIINKVLDRAKSKFSEPTPIQTAWDTLTELGVELKQKEERQITHDLAKLSYDRSRILQTEFENARDEILGKLYEEIKSRFVNLYRELHSEDEKDFDATLKPSGAALDFEVDFYGRGSHPPHAMHSEGHQDSMGVCLFLALSEKLTSNFIDLIILDDVVMSVDSNHRRNLCSLLAKNFPEKQFLITTHDRTWAMQLRINGIVKDNSLYEFFDWSVDTGPHVNDIVDLWDRIDSDVNRSDIPSAAAKLRRGAEQFFAEVCHNIKADVIFQIDGRYELGDLLFSAMRQYKSLIKDANKSFESWGGTTQDELHFMDAERKEVYKRLYGEYEVVNINVHYNEWANFEKNDFIPVVKAYKDLFKLFICDTCQSMIRVVSDGKKHHNVRCNCNSINWNLVKKQQVKFNH